MTRGFIFDLLWQLITKCDSYFVRKFDTNLLKNASGFLLQNATVLLLNAIVITKRDDFTAKCDSYYKMRRLLQTGIVQEYLLLCLQLWLLYFHNWWCRRLHSNHWELCFALDLQHISSGRTHVLHLLYQIYFVL